MNQWISEVDENLSGYGGSPYGHDEEFCRRPDLRNPFYNRVYENHELSDTEVEDLALDEMPSANRNPKLTRKQTAHFDEDGLAEQERGRIGRSQKTSMRSRPTSTISNGGSGIFAKRFSLQPQKPAAKKYEQPLDRRISMFKEPETLQESEAAVGEEPGVDTENMTVDLPDSCGSQVTIIDYSPDDCDIEHYDVEKDGGSMISGSSDLEALQKNLRDVISYRPKWSKVRWIVVNGLSWEAIQPIASFYHLHPLAVEDMLDIPQRIKMDTFENQTFCCFPLHILNITPTPYTLIRKTARCLIVWMFCVISFFQIIISKVKNKKISCFKRRKSQNLPRFQEDVATRVNFSEDQTSYISDSAGKGTGKGTGQIRKLFSFRSGNESITSSQQTSFGDNAEYGDEEICVPFYTLKYGEVCGGASSPVAKLLQEMPCRSIYEWNHGNLSLKNEALQNMHIAGSTNSFEIAMEQVSMFIIDDVVIAFFERSAPAIYQPLEARLQSPMTFLRQTSDPMILVQAVLDASVDLVGIILNEYRTRLNNLQSVSVPRPTLHHTRGLHAFITDMTVLRPHLSSIYQLIQALWPKLLLLRGDIKRTGLSDEKHLNQHTQRHDPSRKERPHQVEVDVHNVCSTFGDDGSDYRNSFEGTNEAEDALDDTTFSALGQQRSQRSVSAATSTVGLYFGDVADHALRHLQDLDDMRNQSKTLSSLLFNTISIRAGDSVKLLSLVSVVFLPLTFLTGYFGMNFKTFSVLDNSVDYYWFVAAPATGALTAFLMYPTILDWVQDIWAWSRDQI